MKRIFLDTNILLDVFLERHPYCHPAQQIWQLSQSGKVKAAISAVSLNNIFYILKKMASVQKAYLAIETLYDLFTVIDLKNPILKKAIKIKFSDFEDALQYFSALSFRAKAIISRDTTGFKQGNLPVMDSSQYLALLDHKDG